LGLIMGVMLTIRGVTGHTGHGRRSRIVRSGPYAGPEGLSEPYPALARGVPRSLGRAAKPPFHDEPGIPSDGVAADAGRRPEAPLQATDRSDPEPEPRTDGIYR
jgi:hypothetical protein